MILFPDLIDHYRPNQTFDATKMEKATAPTTVEYSVKCWIVKPGSGVTPTAFGQVEIGQDTILVHPYDTDGKLRVVRNNDFFEDKATGSRWIADGPGDPIRLPSSFAAVTPRYSHIEVRVVRADLEAATVYPTDMTEP